MASGWRMPVSSLIATSPLAFALSSRTFMSRLAAFRSRACGSTNIHLISAVPSSASTSAAQPMIAPPFRATKKLTFGSPKVATSIMWVLTAGWPSCA